MKHESVSATSIATIPAYSEWRPTRWRVTTTTGLSFGLFTSPEKAARYAYGVQLDEERKGTPNITEVKSASHLVWKGDNIGVGDGPAIVSMLDDFGIMRDWSVIHAVSHRTEIDPYGLGRIVSALRLMADLDQLHSDDLAAWRAVEDEFPVIDACGSAL